MKKYLPFILTFGILVCIGLAVDSAPQKVLAGVSTPPAATAATSAQPAATPQETQTGTTSETRPQTTAQRRSYERETGHRHHHGITKKEVIFLGAIAGTSMGIGAIAAGAHGLAIGSIVGGWGAFAGHFLWNKLH